MIQGIESLVDSRKLKEHYGLMMGAPFNPRLYDIDTAYFHPLYGCLMTDDHVEWFASKVSSTIVTLSPARLGANPPYTCRDKKLRTDSILKSVVAQSSPIGWIEKLS